MKRTVPLKLHLTAEQKLSLARTQEAFSIGCNAVAALARENRCWNRVALHHLSYYPVREAVPHLGAQMVCNAIQKVCGSYKARRVRNDQPVPQIVFRNQGSVHFCSRTLSLKGETLSLFSVDGRIRAGYSLGKRQAEVLAAGKVCEGELVRKKNLWFLHLVIELPDTQALGSPKIGAVDLGENNIAVTSLGTIHGGGKLRHQRDKFLSRRSKLQSNGSRSAKRRAKEISGKEHRHVTEVNHMVSKAIVQEALKAGIGILVLETLTNIRDRIRAGKRVRTRLHRWPWAQLQEFIEYKALAAGIHILYVNPAYTSRTCSTCGHLGTRTKHRFSCPNCGSYQHSDRLACLNLCKLAEFAISAMAPVNGPMVATVFKNVSCKLLPLGKSS